MKLVNLTPHPIVLSSPNNGVTFTVPPSGTVARVTELVGSLRADLDVSPCCCIPLYNPPTMGEVEGLPAPEAGTIYIVSALVATACKGRGDVCRPGTGPADGAIRNEKGHIVAVTRLIAA